MPTRVPRARAEQTAVEMPVDIQWADGLAPQAEAPQSLFQRALKTLALHCEDERLDSEVCVRLCGAEESRALNARFRDKDYPTNVLSFPAADDLPVEMRVLGDLALCWSVVAQEAVEQNKTPQDHLTHLFVHGVLHLLGHDHETPEQAAVMEALEVEVLAALGVANPYVI